MLKTKPSSKSPVSLCSHHCWLTISHQRRTRRIVAQLEASSCDDRERFGPAMDNKQRLANLATNLKGLCRGVSIAVACREIGLNRQQFNKYLSGRHHPSRRSLALICGYFSVAEKDLYRNPVEFSATYHSAENWRLSSFAQLRRFSGFLFQHACIRRKYARLYRAIPQIPLFIDISRDDSKIGHGDL